MRSDIMYKLRYPDKGSPSMRQGREEEAPGMISSTHCHETKHSLITAIWRVFTILLEVAYQTDYQMSIKTLINAQEEDRKR